MENGEIISGVSIQGYIPVRKDPHESSEMVTQVLFGEYVSIMDGKGPWLYVHLLKDNYMGWVDKKCIDEVSDMKDHPNIVSKRNIRVMNVTDKHLVILPIGSAVPAVNDHKFSIADTQFEIEDTDSLVQPGKNSTLELFEALISVPYIWGGRCGFGFDCSGLTQFLSRIAGIEIPRDASQQSVMGKTLNFTSEAITGDLAFFDNADGIINHVGMMIDSDQIIHASGMVRIDRIDQQGIYNEKIGSYTHKLRVIKRIGNS